MPPSYNYTPMAIPGWILLMIQDEQVVAPAVHLEFFFTSLMTFYDDDISALILISS